VHAEDLLVDDCGDGEAVEAVCERLRMGGKEGRREGRRDGRVKGVMTRR